MVDRRRISIRWYAGTILTGLCGAALMGGAVYAALDGETYFAATPERAETLRGSLGSERAAAGLRKTDKLQLTTDTQISRHVMRVSTTTRVGEREVVRMRPFVRIAANLTMTTSELSAGVPPFNAARLLASADPEGTPVAEESQPVEDAEISFVMRDLGAVLPRVKIAGVLPMDEVTTRVREAADWTVTGPNRPTLASAQPGAHLAYAVEGNVDPYAGFETRIVPENITLLPKTATQVTGGNAWNERLVVAKKGDTVASILRDLGAMPDEAKAAAATLGARGKDGGLKEGQKLRILLAPSGAAQRLQPIRIIVMGDSAPEVMAALSDTGKYVAVDVQSAETPQASESDEDDDAPGTVRLYQSIYETALRQQVPRTVVDDLVRIYSYDVDFQRKVQPGDSFELLYPGDEETQGEGRADVLYASLTIGGETKRYYRFQTPDDGVVDYYDETGKSAKKFLVRKPVGAGIMRSGYGWRRHPILGYSKMHTGVDWSAPRGTPIYASGNASVDKVGWESGYGKYIRLKHTYGYETAYGHMSAFARGIQPGARVRQGQVIGYVGSTGLSTGAHLHYEILVNGRFVDPMRIKLPRGRVLEGPVFAGFEQERQRFDGMMTGTPARLAESVPPIKAAATATRKR